MSLYYLDFGSVSCAVKFLVKKANTVLEVQHSEN